MFDETKQYWEQKQRSIIHNEGSKKVLIEIAANHPLKDGDKPSEEFESRLIKGIELYYKEKENGNIPIIYVPGSTHYITKNGEKKVDLIPLAEAGKRYLIEHGIPESGIRANETNIKYQGNKGVYNSGDECQVASRVFKDENCQRLISVVSPVQAFRKALFYNEFGINPEIVTVPQDKTAHNYIGEAFWSLFITTFLDHTWQGEESFLATLTRKERNIDFIPTDKENETLEKRRITFPDEILQIKQKLMCQFKKAQESMDFNISIPYALTLISLSDDEETYKKSILEAIKITQAENKKGRGVSICCKNEKEQILLKQLIQEYSSILERNGGQPLNLNTISCIITEDPIEIYKRSNETSVIKYGRFYKICKADQSMPYSIDAISRGVIPLVTTIPTDHDNYISSTFELYDGIIGKDLIDKLFQDNKTKSPDLEDR